MSADAVDVFRDVLDGLVAAFGASTDWKEKPLTALSKRIDRLASDVENAFCRTDRAAYKEWARETSVATDGAWPPCDAWFEGDFPDAEYRWFDEIF